MVKESLKVGEIDVEVTFKDIKNLHLSVHPPYGKVTVSSPLFYDKDKVKIYVATKLNWIKKEQSKFINQLREQPREFINQETHYFLGAKYLLLIKEGNRNKVVTDGNKLVVHTRDITNKVQKEKQVYQFYRKELRYHLQRYIAIYSQRMGIELPDFKIRVMRTKWGSCATTTKCLWFNIELAKKPLDCIEYIVVHEMVHLFERHHNKQFVLLMDEYLPHWRTQKKILNELALPVYEVK